MGDRTESDGVTAALEAVTLVRGRRDLVKNVSWEIADGQRWVVLGPNGAGKTTLLRLIAAQTMPSTGTVDILGARIGRVDMRALRTRIGFTSPLLVARLRPDLTAEEVVLTGLDAALGIFRTFSASERTCAQQLLEFLGCGSLGAHPFLKLSDGERQRVLLGRALCARPELLVLDEPSSSLDVRGREELLGLLTKTAALPGLRATVLVTHRVEDVPAGFTHALLVRDGEVVAIGPIAEVLADEPLSACFGMSLQVVRAHDRFWTIAAPSSGSVSAFASLAPSPF